MRVLLIDDHALVRNGIAGLLRSRGVDVVAAVGSGEEGVRRALELAPDIVLLDMRMPGKNGIETLGSLRVQAGRLIAAPGKPVRQTPGRPQCAPVRCASRCRRC